MVPRPMDGNSSPRGRHRQRAHPGEPAPVENAPQWMSLSDRPQWTPPGSDERVRRAHEALGRGRGGDPRADWFAPVAAAAPIPPAPAAHRPGTPDGGDPPLSQADPWRRAGAPGGPLGAWPGAEAPGRNGGTATAVAERPEPGGSPGARPGAETRRAAGPLAPAARRGRPHPVRHPVRLVLYAVVLFGLLAGSAAWMALDKSVRLTVDGEVRALSTYASTVGGVLDDAGLTVGEHDVLAPGREARISDGSEIVLRRGRLLRLTVDGKTRQVWVTATTVQEALDQIGYRQNGLFVSATRSERLPLDGYQLTLRTPKTVTVVADGRRQRLVTTAATVGEALDAAGVRVDGDDRVSQLATAGVVDGMTVTVTRVSRKTSTTRTVLRYDTVEREDANAAAGSRRVTTEGVNGLQQVTYVETYVDGKLVSRKVAKVTVLRRPVDEVVVVGPPPPPAQPAECADIPTTGGLNWCGLAKCESGLNPAAYNPAGPYYGLYQFDAGTWQANGGTGLPSEASVAEQTRVAYNLYQARGRAPWPTCGRYL
jgi:resuscitation-promoting factor RpfB